MNAVPNKRRAALAKVHLAKKDLALEDETYRSLLRRVTGHDSSKDCSDGELGRVIEEFKRLGWGGKKRAPRRAGQRPITGGPQAAKIRALWLSLYHLGEVQDPSERALGSFIKDRLAIGVDAPAWLNPAQADKAINALRGWCERVGFLQPDREHVAQVNAWRHQARLEPADWGFAAKVRLIERQWQVLIGLGAMRTGAFARLDTWLRDGFGVAASYYLDPEDADRAVERLGQWVRKAKQAAGDAAPPAAEAALHP